MSNKTRSILKIIAVVLVAVAVMMHINWIAIPSLSVHRFWFVVIAFGVLLVTTK